VIDALTKRLHEEGLSESVSVLVTGCHGFCEQGPLMIVDPDRILYCHLKPDDVSEIVSETIRGGRTVERLLYTDPVSGDKVRTESDVPFYRLQDRVVLGMNTKLDPRSLEDYIAAGGYSALARVLRDQDPDECISEMIRSGLRGRGGGGFPTGRKWQFARAAQGDPKYVICNADEGDPGAYMDRSILEGNPHRVIEGMIIGAYAIGASKGFVYVRAEYPLAVQHTQIAVAQAREAGLIGEGVLGTGFSFDIELRIGAGAFVCGEETALIASIEGERGMPRSRPPFPANAGLYGKPTNINNVETWANVPIVLEMGADAYSQIGTEGSKGTKLFALTGRVKNTGLVEVAMGTPLRTIVFDIGGGSDGVAVKAVQTGGPSGGCLPVDMFDLPVDFDTLKQAGSMVGSGGMVVLDESTCMVDLARFFTDFVQSESCGKCVPCRVGTKRMLEILTRICSGDGQPGDVERLESLGQMIRATSLCGLGQTAPNPVLSTIRYFRNEYDAHILEKRCPAGACQALIGYRILPDVCTGCGLCLKTCPVSAITGEKKQPHAINPAICIKCGACYEKCRFDAIIIE
jgi:NADH:ubiquinone oxidoreductase subunit F (NADH-binding)/(2Fe-2S) ferredoxin/Pyruvate/2-oxoacid:ferredoxin oxidoreductase delta subunit